ncbi:MAG: polysulfide reductase NrfD [Prolixibacteraceae bacterium]|jgi:predicted membrane protein|nr:polysulfide reductase NrfD [Prolixibacteraceae bacterium]
MNPEFESLYQALSKVDGFIYPNEIELSWSILIVLYPFITGLVAGAFILASLERVFNVKSLKPTYVIALLTSFAFLLVATMPLIFHLGQPLRAWEIMITPHLTSAMAIFGFVYLWYLMIVLLLEIWFDYRYDLVLWARESTGIKKWMYKALALGSDDISPKSLKLDSKLGYIVTVLGIPSAFLLHGYVGFIFGSIKANPWWSTVMMPIIFLFSAMVSGIALVMVLFIVINYIRKQKIDMLCLDTIAKYLFYIIIIDFTMESLDQIHRFYEAEESFEIISLLMSGHLEFTLLVMQIGIGMMLPLATLGILQFYKPKEKLRITIYLITGILVLIGIFFMRWNVVIGGQLFSKSFLGFTSFKLSLIGSEGFLMASIWLIVPFFILAFLLWIFPPWRKTPVEH